MRFIPMLTFIVAFSLLGCDSSGGGDLGPTPVASGVALADIGNSNDGSDLEVFFRKPIPSTGVSEYRIIVVKESVAGTFDLAAANAVGSSNYVTVGSASASTVELSASAVDSDGDAIVDGTSFVAFVLAIADGSDADVNSLSSPSPPLTLEQVTYVSTLVVTIPIGTGGMETDPQGNVYAADFGLTLAGGGPTVQKITPAGDVSTFASGLNGASGNAFDSQGNLMQSNITGGFISRISPSGVATTFVSSGLSGPVGIAIDASDNLYVANCNSNTIQLVTNAGASSQFSSGSLFNCPNGIALASDGNFYVANFSNGTVVRIAPDGTPSSFATLPGGNNGHITFANGVLYVVDRGGNRIYQLALDGTLSVVAGSGTRGHADGGATEASFSAPNDLSVSPDGKLLYVNEVVPLTGAAIGPTSIRVIELPQGSN